MSKRKKPPTYRHHKQSGQAVVTLPDGAGGRKDFLLGPYGSPESKAEYARVLAEWEAGGRHLTSAKDSSPDLSVNEVLLAYVEYLEAYYRKADGTPTSEAANIKLAIRPVRELYGLTPARNFDSLAIEAVRNRMIEKGNCRSRINKDIARVKRLFKWAASKKLVPLTVFQSLQTVEGLRSGRSPAKESDPVKPVPLPFVQATIAAAGSYVGDMIELQLLTGMRPGELTGMRGIDLEMSGPVWFYHPEHHKNAYRGHARNIAIGPKGQAIVRRHLKTNLQACLFSPADAVGSIREEKRARRKTKVQPSQQARSKANPKRKPGDRYTKSSYCQAIYYACARADKDAHRNNPAIPADQEIIPRWHPNQLRHTRATELRKQYGIDAARAVLGHRSTAITEVYAELDMTQTADIMFKIG